MFSAITDLGVVDGVIVFAILAAIPLVASMLVGLVLSVIQAATQIQEQTLTFVPKLFTICIILFLLGPWMSAQLEEYFRNILHNVALISRS
jgi:flagellar biosynthesis protein FliQ